MKKLLLTLSIPALVITTTYPQDYEGLAKKAVEYLLEEDLDNFEQTCTRLYPEYVKSLHPYYISAVEAAKSGDAKTATGHLKELLDEDYFLDEITEDPNFAAIHGGNHWDDLLRFLEEKKSGYDNELRIGLKEIQYRDQGIRVLLMQHFESPGIEKRVHNVMQQIDSESADRICAILDEHGWLGPDVIGSEGNQTLFLAIQHVNDLTIQEKYMPILREAAEQDDAEPWHLDFLTDRILMNQGKKQIYGTQKIIRSDIGRQFIVPLENPANVDKLRNEMGMGPLAEALAEDGWPWDMDEYLSTADEIEETYREWYELFK